MTHDHDCGCGPRRQALSPGLTLLTGLLLLLAPLGAGVYLDIHDHLNGWWTFLLILLGGFGGLDLVFIAATGRFLWGAAVLKYRSQTPPSSYSE